MAAQLPEYDVTAIRYATRDAQRQEHFIEATGHGGPMPMDYFVWLVRHGDRCFVVDTGFHEEMAAKRGRRFLRRPRDGLALLGVDAAQVQDVIVTHMHYDHVGTFTDFPRARFHLQDTEMAFATGRHMCHGYFQHAYEVDDVTAMVRLAYQDRVVFHEGTQALAPGLSVHHIGGHTAGLQCVRVWTRRGWVVLASDASHYYEQLRSNTCFKVAFHLGQMLEGYRTLRALAESEAHIIPGHDPLVMRRYPAVSQALEGIAVRLDADPLG